LGAATLFVAVKRARLCCPAGPAAAAANAGSISRQACGLPSAKFVAPVRLRVMLMPTPVAVLPRSGFRHDAHPMAIMVGVVGALAAFYPEVAEVR